MLVIVIYYHSMQALVQRYIISDIMGCKKDTKTDHNQVASWQSSFFLFSTKTSEQSIIHQNFPWPAVLKIFCIVSITGSFGNQANNFSTVLQKGFIFTFWIYVSNEWGKYKACLLDFNSNVHNQISLTLVKINP